MEGTWARGWGKAGTKDANTKKTTPRNPRDLRTSMQCSREVEGKEKEREKEKNPKEKDTRSNPPYIAVGVTQE